MIIYLKGKRQIECHKHDEVVQGDGSGWWGQSVCIGRAVLQEDCECHHPSQEYVTL